MTNSSVRLSVGLYDERMNCDKTKNFGPHSYIIWEADASSFVKRRVVRGERPFPPQILRQNDPHLF